MAILIYDVQNKTNPSNFSFFMRGEYFDARKLSDKENQKPLLMLVLKLTFGIHKTNILILSLSPYLLLTSAIRSGSHRVK